MRSGSIFILLTSLTLVFAQSALARNAYTRQGSEIRRLERYVWGYHDEHGKYPVTDAQNTWFEKLVEYGGDLGIRNVTPDGRFPLDFYANPLVFEPPSSANGNQIVIRAVGQNGIDNHGMLDDWDIRFGPNIGYWYKKRWPAAYRRAWICGVLALIGLIFIFIKVEQAKTKLVFASLWFGFLAGVVLPIGFDRGWGGHSSASIDPRWIEPISGLGVLLLQATILLLIIYRIRTALYRRSLRLSGAIPCKKCDYDLRGTIAANINRCPECGETVPEDSDVDIDLTPPPSP
jgi:hypothetical protein